MELRAIKETKITSERKKILDERESLRNEAAKTYGKFLINMTNLCFDKCINTDNIYYSKNEERCIKSYFTKYSEINNYDLFKFNEINKDIDYSITSNYITNINDLN
jgi:hypothetical protein